MTFYFGNKKGDTLMTKINLRDISAKAKHWNHPVSGLFKYAESMKKADGNILKLPKKDRELYCVSLVALALADDTKVDWWINMPDQDPPDGFVMTLTEEKRDMYRIRLRGVEVVEHRNGVETLFNTIEKKMTENSYESNTILVCLVLTPGSYDFRELSIKLQKVDSTLEHVFVIFAGMKLEHVELSKDLSISFGMVQLLPVFESHTFDYGVYLDDFSKRYELGQESRLIESGKIYFSTSNPKYRGGK